MRGIDPARTASQCFLCTGQHLVLKCENWDTIRSAARSVRTYLWHCYSSSTLEERCRIANGQAYTNRTRDQEAVLLWGLEGIADIAKAINLDGPTDLPLNNPSPEVSSAGETGHNVRRLGNRNLQ